MRKHFIVAGLFMLFVTVGFGQHGWKFRSDDYVGLASGQLGNYGVVETVNGVCKGPWFLGIGAGLDYYRFRSIPLFVSVTRELPIFPKAGGLFVYLDGGIDLPRYTKSVPFDAGFDSYSSRFHAGTWYNGSLGYRIKLGAKTQKALLFSAGYGVKKLKEEDTAPAICAVFGACQIGTEMYVYEYLNRMLLLRIGFSF